MSHTFELNRQTRREPVKTGGILINPEDCHPSMRDRIHTDLNSSRTYVILKPFHSNSRPQTREVEIEFTRTIARREPIKTGGVIINPEDALPSMRNSLLVNPKTGSTFALLKPASAPVSRKTSFELTRAIQRDPVKTGGVLINPEDALPSMRHTLLVNPRTGATYALLKPHRENQRKLSSASEGTTRTFEYEFIRNPQRKEIVRTGGVIVRPEDALPSMRHSLHVNPTTGSTYAILKPFREVEKKHGSSGADLERTRTFEYEFVRNAEKREPVKTGGVIVRPEDAKPSMRHSLHVNPTTGSTYAILKPHREVERESRGSIDTRGSLDDFTSHIDAVISRSRNVLSQSYVESMPSLGYLPEASCV